VAAGVYLAGSLCWLAIDPNVTVDEPRTSA